MLHTTRGTHCSERVKNAQILEIFHDKNVSRSSKQFRIIYLIFLSISNKHSYVSFLVESKPI